MKKYQYTASWDDQTLTRVTEPVVVLGDQNISAINIVFPPGFEGATTSLIRVWYRLPGEKESRFVDLDPAEALANGTARASWVINHSITEHAAGKLLFSVEVIGENKNYSWNSRAVSINVNESCRGASNPAADEESGGGSPGGIRMAFVTWAELKTLRDDGQLIPGQTYRITDYICTTTQEGSRVESHPYDIIVTADSETALSEIARACAHDGASAEYYQHTHIEAWELKYSIDNDTSRFAWADEENGHGVVYYLKDDHGNECPYDFKQIQFVRYPITACTVSSLVGKYTTLNHGSAITGTDEENPVWCFTFSYGPTGVMSDASVMEFNTGNFANVSQNIIKDFYNYQESDEVGVMIAYLNDIVFVGNKFSSNTFGNNCNSNTFGNNSYSNTFENNCYFNTFGDNCSNAFRDDCRSNTFGNNCRSNTFRDNCGFNTFGNNCMSNTFGDNCGYNTFGDNCGYNTFGNHSYSNTFGDDCGSNTFGENCYFNTFGINSYSNTFGDDCGSNTFGENCYFNMFGNNSCSNTFGKKCSSNTLGNNCSFVDISTGTSPGQKRYYHVLDGVAGSNSSHIAITGTNGNNFVTYVGMNSSGVLKTWVPADLAQ